MVEASANQQRTTHHYITKYFQCKYKHRDFTTNRRFKRRVFNDDSLHYVQICSHLWYTSLKCKSPPYLLTVMSSSKERERDRDRCKYDRKALNIHVAAICIPK